ncbi:MAG: VWA domain-containing protein, partial [Anaerolineae bacterium]|nr:VWA domain-containing protein [Anaerolineae bacterium]
MKNRTQTLILFTLLALIFAACQTEQPEVVEVTRMVTNTVVETVTVEGQTVEVTRVVVETVVAEPSADPYNFNAQEAPAEEATAPLLPANGHTETDSNAVAPMPFPTALATAPAAARNAMFFEQYGVNPYILTSVDGLSTFSLDVDTGSYNVAKRYLQDGLMPPPEAVRVEEFVNSFDQGYKNPPDVAFAIYADGAPSPFHNDGTVFLRIGVQGYDVPEAERPSANLVFVIDVSGSMEQENRLGLVKESLALLVDRLRADDKVSIVVYGNSARTVLYPTAGSERQAILNAINTLQTEGSTNLEAGLL